MSEALRISIVTVVLNGAAHLEDAIRSVLSQNYANLEYVIVDGGSTDGTLDIIRKYRSSIAKYVSEPDQGIADAFNKGIALCSGAIIGLLNADDMYMPDCFAVVTANATHVDVLYGSMTTLSDHGLISTYIPDHNFLERDMTLCHPAAFVARSAYEKFGVFSQKYRYAMDYELLLRFKSRGATFSRIDKTLTSMRDGGTSKTNWEDAYREVMAAQDEHLVLSPMAIWKRNLVLQRKRLGASLEQTRLASVVQFYKQRFSIIKKVLK